MYKAALPAGGTGSVALTQLATFTGVTNMFYALAFTPTGSLDPNNEILVGGDGAGTVWSIDTSSGATKNLGNFGADPSNMCTSGNGCTLGLSGDIVFYLNEQRRSDGAGDHPVLRDRRQAAAANDWLAGVDMTALATAYTSGNAGDHRARASRGRLRWDQHGPRPRHRVLRRVRSRAYEFEDLRLHADTSPRPCRRQRSSRSTPARARAAW